MKIYSKILKILIFFEKLIKNHNFIIKFDKI